MVRDGLCRCDQCGTSLDPTVLFQKCDACGGRPVLARRRYRCSRCGSEVTSRFLYDGRVFDAEYFRTKMAESRQRQKDRRRSQTVERLVARSAAICPGPADLEGSPGLLAAIDRITGAMRPQGGIEQVEAFDLSEYQRRVLAGLTSQPIEFRAIPTTGQPSKTETARLFMATVFLMHVGRVTVEQHGDQIMVMKRETNGERQAVPRDAESVDGFGGPLGGAEA